MDPFVQAIIIIIIVVIMIDIYGPNPKVYAYIEKLCLDKKNVLEIGPGDIPFSKATHFCGWDKGLTTN
jgi:hypothetical protein